MSNEQSCPNLNKAYEHLLADLLQEIEAEGVPALIPKGERLVGRERKPISLALPPTPPIFHSLPDDALANIRWGVQIYHDFLKPLGAIELKKLAGALYALAQNSAKNLGEDEKSERVVEKYLTMTMLANRREALQENSHLNFYLLLLMQLGRLRRILKNEENADIAAICYEIERLHERDTRELNKQKAVIKTDKQAARKEAEKRTHSARSAVNARHKENSQHARQYTEERFLEMVREKTEKGSKISKRQIAFDIHRELAKKHPRDEFESENEDQEMRKTGWFFPKDRERFYTDWILPDSEKWMEQAVT